MRSGFLVPGAIGPVALGGAAAGLDWWPVAGQTCVAAYQPIGAASLAASYVNLANPGTYDAAPGVAPTLAAGGWQGNGSTQYLTTGIVPSGDQTWTMLCRFADGASPTRNIIGLVQTGGAARWFALQNNYVGFVRYCTGGVTSSVAPSLASGIIGFAGRQPYRNGVADGVQLSVNAATITTDIYIGARHVNASVDEFFAGTIAAVAIYSTTLSAADVAALTTRMQALA